MAERASMPTFVPRTVASFERTATALARRVATPVRTLAARALSFADRLMGSWAGAGPTVGGFESGGERPAMRAATRSGGMLLPRPWYEVDADEDAIWPQQAARAAVAAASERRADGDAVRRERGDGARGAGGRARRGDRAHGADGGARCAGVAARRCERRRGDAATRSRRASRRRAEAQRLRGGGAARMCASPRRSGCTRRCRRRRRSRKRGRRRGDDAARARAGARGVGRYAAARGDDAGAAGGARDDGIRVRRADRGRAPTTTTAALRRAREAPVVTDAPRAPRTVVAHRGARRRRALPRGRRGCPIRSCRRRCRRRSRSG